MTKDAPIRGAASSAGRRIACRQVWAVAGLVAISLSFAAGRVLEAAESGPARPPNVVLIFSDDLGYHDLGCQGSTAVPTPNIDSIAANGIRLTNAYVTTPICSPSRAGLLTGRYPQRFGHEMNPPEEPQELADFGLPLTEKTIADRLKALGYRTGAIGKWHLGSSPQFHPLNRGFDEFFGFLEGLDAYFPEKRKNPIWRGREKVDEPEYLTEAFAREAVDFIERNKKEPFFLYVPFNAVHGPFQVTDKYLKRFEGLAPDSKALAVPGGSRTYYAMISALDDAVGRILETLRRLNLDDDTLVIFLNDNGGAAPSKYPHSNLPLSGSKGTLLEGGVRIPCLMQWVGHLPAGQVYEQPVISLDLLPTAIALAGGKVAADWKLDGVNLLPYLTGEAKGAPHDTLYWRFAYKWAIRRGDWKLMVERKGETPRLFNLSQDIAEKNDLAKEHPDKVKELQAAYEAWAKQLPKPTTYPAAVSKGSPPQTAGSLE